MAIVAEFNISALFLFKSYIYRALQVDSVSKKRSIQHSRLALRMQTTKTLILMKLSLSFTIAIALAVITLSCSPGKKEESGEKKNEPFTMDLLVGTYTDSGSDGIYRLKFNPETGQLSDAKLMAKASNPSYLAISKDKKAVFAVNENDPGEVTSFRWDKEADTLAFVGRLSSQGAHPCFIDLGPGDKTVAVANYSSGNIVVFGVGSNGALSPSPQIRQHEGNGPDQNRQEGPHAHCSLFKENFLYAVDLGIDKIMSYGIQADGSLGEAQVAFELEPGDGPRHLEFHPSRKLAFVVNELSNSVVVLQADHAAGTFQQVGRYSTLPPNFEGKSFVADVHISADGRFLYVSNRGHNSIAIFAVADDGQLSSVGHEPVKGDWPRNFVISPDGNFLLVANQNSNNVVVFKLNKETGLLSHAGFEMKLSKPVCLKF